MSELHDAQAWEEWKMSKSDESRFLNMAWEIDDRGNRVPILKPIDDRYFERQMKFANDTHINVDKYDAPDGKEQGVCQLGVQVNHASIYTYLDEDSVKMLRKALDEWLEFCERCREDM